MIIIQAILIVLELKIFQKKLKNHRKQKYIRNIYRIQAYGSIMCGYLYWIGFVLDLLILC